MSNSPNEGKSFPSKGNSRCKGPEAGTRLVCLRKSKKARVARASTGRRKGETEEAGGCPLTQGLSVRKTPQVRWGGDRLSHCGRGMVGFFFQNHAPSSLLPHPPCETSRPIHSLRRGSRSLQQSLAEPDRALSGSASQTGGSSGAGKGLPFRVPWHPAQARRHASKNSTMLMVTKGDCNP